MGLNQRKSSLTLRFGKQQANVASSTRRIPHADLQERRGSWGQQITGESTAASLFCLSPNGSKPTDHSRESRAWLLETQHCWFVRVPPTDPAEPVPVQNPGCQHRAILPPLHNKTLIGFISRKNTKGKEKQIFLDNVYSSWSFKEHFNCTDFKKHRAFHCIFTRVKPSLKFV